MKTPSTRHGTRCLCAMAWRWTSRRGTPRRVRPIEQASEVTSSDVHLRSTPRSLATPPTKKHDSDGPTLTPEKKLRRT